MQNRPSRGSTSTLERPRARFGLICCRSVFMVMIPLGVLSYNLFNLQALAATGGVYTAAQAQAGAQIYTQQCSECHGDSLEGSAGPALTGPQFKEAAAAQALTVGTLLNIISSTMPQSNPGSLSVEQNNEVTAYILQQNGYPEGSVPLSADAPGVKELKLTN